MDQAPTIRDREATVVGVFAAREQTRRARIELLGPDAGAAPPTALRDAAAQDEPIRDPRFVGRHACLRAFHIAERAGVEAIEKRSARRVPIARGGSVAA